MVAGVSTQIKVWLDANLSPQANSARLASIAITARDRLIAAGQASPVYDTFVDGTKGGDIQQAKQVIQFKFDYMSDAVQFALKTLQRFSPPPGRGSNSGKVSYVNNFMISDGTQAVPAAMFDFSQVKNGDTIIIYNNAPYGRKVDTPFIGSGPNRKELKHPNNDPFIFARAASEMRKKYSTGITVQRLYTVTVAGQWRRKTGKKRNGLGRLTEYPALEITINR